MILQSSDTDQRLQLGIAGFEYADLYDPAGLSQLSALFDEALRDRDPETYTAFQAYRSCRGEGMQPQQISELLVTLAPHLGEFVARLFNVGDIRERQIETICKQFDSVFVFRSEIVAKLNGRGGDRLISDQQGAALERQVNALLTAVDPVGWQQDPELALSRLAVKLLTPAESGAIDSLKAKIEASSEARGYFENALVQQDPAMLTGQLLDSIRGWCLAATQLPELRAFVSDWVSFKVPGKTDFSHLVDHETELRSGCNVWRTPRDHRRKRIGFGLTDKRFDERRVLYEVDHCIYCHDRDTDSCAKGMRNKKDGSFKTNPLGVKIIGCPLEEKISEMHLVKRRGDNIGALALIVIDNPMCPGTGHRICNDCMKGCIYQKTEPVNIPQIETNVLTDVLFMPWGFEIYSLLTRWNPLNVRRPHALAYNGKNVLVVGMGPAGYTLAHYLLNEGFAVTGIDALKIEPLPTHLTGDRQTPPQPIRDFAELYDELDKRVMLGFGGVAEYGITVRWDKNFLKVIYLNLLRRSTFQCFGGVRFGGTMTVPEAWDMGFHHIAVAAGAGKPTIIELENNLIRGIRKASDFLMALQLTGAAKASSLSNLQVRLPAGVIGGGLTAIDTATELLAYYPVQVLKIRQRYEKLTAVYGEQNVRSRYDDEEQAILDEFLSHAQQLIQERERAAAAGETPDYLPLLNQWGGVTLFYRKGIKDSPAYRQNHEEIREALAEGITLAEGMNPLAASADAYGHLQSLRFAKMAESDGRWQAVEDVDVPLRSLFVAAGTSPNTLYEAEHPDTFVMDGKFYRRHELEGAQLTPVEDTEYPKIGRPSPFTSYRHQGRYITFFGDNHPVYAGNVVKAMASAKDGYPYIVKLFEDERANTDADGHAQRLARLEKFQARLNSALSPHVVAVNRLTPTIIEVIVKAPLAAKKFSPGQFYRVQNFETLAPVKDGTVLASEGVALTGAWVDKEQGLISLIALEMGSSTRLCATWKPNDPIVVMGVTGTPTEIPTGKTVLLAGGGLGNAVLFSIGKALRAAGNRVIYFAGYRNREDLFKVEDIEAASDLIVWSVDKRPGNEPIPVTRDQDKSFVGNIIESMQAYAAGELGAVPIPLNEVDHLIVIGSDRMMAAVKQARYGLLKPYLKPEHEAIGSINSPMQCMMKGICAQCLCKHIDPDSGQPYFVYSCYNQDQPLDRVDFENLAARLRQNSVQEKLSSLWLTYLLEQEKTLSS